MPGCGKSTLGVLLAKALAKPFVDTDLLIQEQMGATLQDFLDVHGHMALRQQEERVVLISDLENKVVATGGSVVYSSAAMAKLKRCGVCVFLDVPPEELYRRVANFSSRGIASAPNTTLEMLYRERLPFYRQYGDYCLRVNGQTPEQMIEQLLELLSVNSPL